MSVITAEAAENSTGTNEQVPAGAGSEAFARTFMDACSLLILTRPPRSDNRGYHSATSAVAEVKPGPDGRTDYTIHYFRGPDQKQRGNVLSATRLPQRWHVIEEIKPGDAVPVRLPDGSTSTDFVFTGLDPDRVVDLETPDGIIPRIAPVKTRAAYACMMAVFESQKI